MIQFSSFQCCDTLVRVRLRYVAGMKADETKPENDYGSADVHIGHRKLATSEPAGTLANRRQQITGVDVVKK